MSSLYLDWTVALLALVVLNYCVKKDSWGSVVTLLAIAVYFALHGWIKQEPIGVFVGILYGFFGGWDARGLRESRRTPPSSPPCQGRNKFGG